MKHYVQYLISPFRRRFLDKQHSNLSALEARVRGLRGRVLLGSPEHSSTLDICLNRNPQSAISTKEQRSPNRDKTDRAACVLLYLLQVIIDLTPSVQVLSYSFSSFFLLQSR